MNPASKTCPGASQRLEKLEGLTGFRPATSLDDIVDGVVAYFREKQECRHGEDGHRRRRWKPYGGGIVRGLKFRDSLDRFIPGSYVRNTRVSCGRMTAKGASKLSSKIRVGLIGYGYWGPNYARVLNDLLDVSLAFVCDAREEQLRRAAARFPQVPLSQDVSEALRRDDADAVIISTPASTHYELARLALESGRHVIVEKPLALEIEHCEHLGELADKKGLVLMVAHTFLYNSGIQKLREFVKSPNFGRVYYLHATRTNLGPIRADVNAVWDLAPHDISIFNYLLDEQPQWASAIGSRALGNTREDVAFITLGYANDVIGNIHVSWADPNKVREVVVGRQPPAPRLRRPQ